ncbi:polyamine ABC transporter substrate-binding protein [Rhizobiales bacterium TNE-4]|nr:polyamine ABC transporter substrate-binding protein [Rhizobiales bacterium TNE-4]MBV1826140.1 polyamine ABC transporter substrate-binding protein [Rhizobiales bacterium TNE-4]
MKKIAFSLIASALLATSALAQEKVVNVYNWSDYVDPTVLEDFTKATGIKVVYDTYDNNEIVETKLLAGKSGYDIVVPSGPFLQRLIEQKVFLPIDRAKVPEIKNAWPEIEKRLQAFDPGNKFAVNYMWGTTGLGYNVAKIKQRLGNTPIDSWDIVLKPENLAKLKDCGVMMLDAPEDIFPGVLRALGLDPDSKKAADYQKAADALMKVRGNVRKFHSSEYINALANGDICFVVGYSGDILQAKKRAEEAKNGIEIAYAIPKEGALMWFDSMAIPADAPNKDNALAFINFMMKPEIAARNSNFVSYASGNLAAKALIKPEIANNPGIYPTADVMGRLFTNSSPDEKLQKQITRLWTKVKTGK